MDKQLFKVNNKDTGIPFLDVAVVPSSAASSSYLLIGFTAIKEKIKSKFLKKFNVNY